MTGKKAALVFTLCLLAPFFFPSFVVAVMKKPSLYPANPPTKTLTALHTKPTLPDKTEEVKLDIPLDDGLVEELHTVCSEYNVPVSLALAVMEQESQFTVDAVGWDGHDIGLFQLRDTYHWWLTEQTGADPMTPEGNIKCGVWLLGHRLEEYGDTAAALTAYRWGSDNGERQYSVEVLERAEKMEQNFERRRRCYTELSALPIAPARTARTSGRWPALGERAT